MATADTQRRILDAALAVMSRHGLSRLALEDVAREAGLSRQTVYRYVGSRDGLIQATILREEEVFLERMRTAAAAHHELEPALRAAIGSALSSARSHPLLDRLLQTEPEALLPFLTDGTGPVLSAAQTVVVELLTRYAPHLDERRRARAADAATRLIVSYAISPADAPNERLADDLALLLSDGLARR